MRPTLVPFFTSFVIISGFVFRFFVSLHRPFSDFFPTVRLWRDRKRPAKRWQDIFVSCFETSYSSLTRRLPVNFSSQSDFDSSAFRHWLSQRSCILGADQKECSLWERDCIPSQIILWDPGADGGARAEGKLERANKKVGEEKSRLSLAPSSAPGYPRMISNISIDSALQSDFRRFTESEQTLFINKFFESIVKRLALKRLSAI